MLFIKFWYFNYDCVVLFRCTSSHEYDIQRTFFQQIFEGLNVKYKLFDSSFWVPYFHRFYALQRTRAAFKVYTDQLHLQKSIWFLFTYVSFGTSVSFKVQLNKNTLKQTKFEDKTVKSTQPSLVLVGLHDFLIFSNRTAHAWSVKAGNICSVSVSFFRVGSQISPRRAKKDSNIPSPGRTRSVKCPTPGPTKTIKSPPYALPPPCRLNIDRCITCIMHTLHFLVLQQ